MSLFVDVKVELVSDEDPKKSSLYLYLKVHRFSPILDWNMHNFEGMFLTDSPTMYEGISRDEMNFYLAIKKKVEKESQG